MTNSKELEANDVHICHLSLQTPFQSHHLGDPHRCSTFSLSCFCPHTLTSSHSPVSGPSREASGQGQPSPSARILGPSEALMADTYTFPDSCSISSHCVCSNSDSAANKTFPCREEEPE